MPDQNETAADAAFKANGGRDGYSIPLTADEVTAFAGYAAHLKGLESAGLVAEAVARSTDLAAAAQAGNLGYSRRAHVGMSVVLDEVEDRRPGIIDQVEALLRDRQDAALTALLAATD